MSNVRNPGWLMIGSGTILTNILGIIIVHEVGISINEPVEWSGREV